MACRSSQASRDRRHALARIWLVDEAGFEKTSGMPGFHSASRSLPMKPVVRFLSSIAADGTWMACFMRWVQETAPRCSLAAGVLIFLGCLVASAEEMAGDLYQAKIY